MKLGDYQDGRELTYDEVAQAYAIGGTPVTLDEVIRYDAAQQITWLSEELRGWAQSMRASAVPPAPSGTPASVIVPAANATAGQHFKAPTTQAAKVPGKPWYKKWWVWAIAAVLVIGIGTGGGGESARDDEGKSAKVEAAQNKESAPAAKPAPEPLDMSATAPATTEAPTVEVKGKTLPGASVSVGGKPATVDANGAFALAVGLADGDNLIEVKATLEGHKDASEIVTVKRVTFPAIESRDFQLVVKDPDAHVGETFVLWGEVTQFDSATGADQFRANAGAKKLPIEYGFTSYDTNSMFIGDEATLANLVQGDCFSAKVEVVGSYSYDTQIGGSTTVPQFKVYAVSTYGSTAD